MVAPELHSGPTVGTLTAKIRRRTAPNRYYAGTTALLQHYYAGAPSDRTVASSGLDWAALRSVDGPVNRSEPHMPSTPSSRTPLLHESVHRPRDTLELLGALSAPACSQRTSLSSSTAKQTCGDRPRSRPARLDAS